MAQTQRVRRIRNVHESSALTYGHFGSATYDDNNHSWEFLRNDISSNPAGRGSEVSSQAALLIDQKRWSLDEIVARSSPCPNLSFTSAQRRLLLRNVPEAALVSKREILESLPPDSKARDLSSISGNVLDFGYARHSRDHSYGVVYEPILAIRCGKTFEKVHFFRFERGNVTLPADDGDQAELQFPSARRSSSGQWATSGVCVEQTSFDMAKSRDQMLIRDSTGTSIFRPLMKDRVDLQDKPTRSPLVLPNLLVTIPCSETGGMPHADAAFCPTDRNCLALVDTAGNWSIWRVKKGRQFPIRVNCRAHLLSKGDMHLAQAQDTDRPWKQATEGWHALSWLLSSDGIADRILVCSRTTACVFRINEVSLGEVNTRLGPPSDGNQILQVKQGLLRRHHVYMLTSSRLLIFDSTLGQNNVNATEEALVMICSWNHFRHSLDLGLRMSIVETSQYSGVLLYSNTNSFVTMYQFYHESLPGDRLRSSNPAIFELPDSLTRGDSPIENIHLWPIGSPTPLDSRDYLKLVALTANGTVVEAVYSIKTLAKAHSASPLDMSLLTPTLPTSEHQYRSSRFVNDDMIGDFIVEDDIVDRSSKILDMGGVDNSPIDPAYSSRIRQWDGLSNHPELLAGENSRLAIQDAQDRLLHRLDNLTITDQNLRVEILGDILQHPQIVDIEADSQEFPVWLESHCDVRGLRRRSALSGSGATKSPELLLVYDHCLLLYVHSLSANATDRNRVVRERMTRQIAADMVFGGIVLSPRVLEGTIKQQASNDADADKAYLAGQGSSSQAQEPVIENGQVSRDLALSRLDKYTTFKRKSHATATPLSISASVILGHLPESIDENPDLYSYEKRNNELRIERDEAAVLSLDMREQRRLAKVASKRQRALERQALLSQSIHQQRQMLPAVIKSRVPALPLRDFQSSQPAMPESSQGQSQVEVPGISMTQPEPGAFGVRPVKPKGKGKKVARVQGF
ncbi:hypothetical protein PV10_08396 [Exophiala mesophila]|uniref:RNA polymerase I-specific transcription initiation factor RRN6-like protein n=1 Tax=Exophiala mesophila TaxID=212818 RepID=A0A0D1Z496_EXOME|nr:uncharacterized protein PV10_08396 [Exophiala mesophila]KIV88744.1 hypothetical protein PV10_08396 [Exophiala mesophila]